MTNSIVTVNVSQRAAPTPNRLQKKGALISQGGTTLDAGETSLLTVASDLDDILVDAIALTSLNWAATDGGTVTGSTSSNHLIEVGQEFTISGVTATAYNGNYLALAGTTGNVIKYALSPNPGLATVLGEVVPYSASELQEMVDTFFAQGSQQGVWVLELGPSSAADGIAVLDDYISNNSDTFYSYLVPRAWADEATFLTFVADFEAATAKTYFYTTMDADNYTTFTALMKSVKGMIESPDKASGEFSHASDFQHDLNYDPGPTNRITPNAFAYLFGVTPYPLPNNGPTLAAYKAANVNVVATGAEGGITNTILKWGTTKDGRDFAYWYSVDWVQINAQQATAAAVINGSNDPVNPLYYNQAGINRLQAVCASVLSAGVSFGMVLGTVVQTSMTPAQFQNALNDGTFDGQAVVNAIPFLSYLDDNPTHYAEGTYNGLSITFAQQRGFKSITIDIVVTDFVTQ